jgi:Spy/CpxP family protein refolding chaperone
VEKREVLRTQVLTEEPKEVAIRLAAAKLGKAIGDAAVKASTVVKNGRQILTPEQAEKWEQLFNKIRTLWQASMPAKRQEPP